MIRTSILAVTVMAVTVFWTETFVGSQVVSFESAKLATQHQPSS